MDDARFQGPFRGQLCQPPAPVSVPVPRPPVPSYWKALGFGLLVALPGGLLSGLAAFMGGPVLGWLAVLLLGYCVGAVVANSGRQGDFRFGVLATLLALLGTSLARLEACWCVTLIQLGVLPHVPTFHPEAVGLFLAAAWHWDDLLQYGVVAAVAAIVAVRRPKLSLIDPVLAQKRRQWRTTTLTILGIAFAFAAFFMTVSRVRIDGLAASPDGRFAASFSGWEASIEKKAVVYNAAGEVVEKILGARGPVAWSPDGRFLAVHTRVWHASGPRLREIQDIPSGDCLAFSPDSRAIAVAWEGVVHIWPLGPGSETGLASGAVVYRLAYSPDGKRLVAGRRDGTAIVWELATGNSQTWKAHRAAVTGLVFAPDGQTILTAGGIDPCVKTWDAGTFAELQNWSIDMDWIAHLSLSPDGRTLAVSGGLFHRPGTVLLLDRATGQERSRFTVHANTVVASIFSSDGATLIAATSPTINSLPSRRHGEIYRWDLATGQPLPPPR
jgi:hypothetical protein